MNIAAKWLVVAVCTSLCSLASCTDDFSRFQFGQKKPVKRDAGAQNMSDATGTDPDGGAGGSAAQSE